MEKLKEMTWAALVLQRALRSRKARFIRLVLRHQRQVKFSAATKIQSLARGVQGRAFCSMLRKIKRIERREASRRRKEKRREQEFKKLGAALQLQRWWNILQGKRGEEIRMRLTRLRMARRLQSAFRCYFARKRLQELVAQKKAHEAAVLHAVEYLQPIFRGWIAKKKTAKMLKAIKAARKAERKRRREARKLAKKGNVVKVELFGQKLTSINTTRAREQLWKFSRAIDLFLPAKEKAAALFVQRVWRGKRARKRMQAKRQKLQAAARALSKKTYMDAVLRLQRVYRGHKVRGTFLRDKQDSAATKVQSLYRGRRDRRIAFRNAELKYAAVSVALSVLLFYVRVTDAKHIF